MYIYIYIYIESCIFLQDFIPPSAERFSARSCKEPTKFPSSTSWDFNWSPDPSSFNEKAASQFLIDKS